MGMLRRIGFAAAVGVVWASVAGGQAIPGLVRLPIPASETGAPVVGESDIDLMVRQNGPTEVGPTEVWRTDGTAAGTRLLATLNCPYSNGVRVGDRLFSTVQKDKKLIAAAVGPDGVVQELPDAGNAVMFAVPAGGRLMIPINGQHPSIGMTSTDGTPEGTVVLVKPTDGQGSTSFVVTGPTPATAIYTNDGSLWITDGTPKGTRNFYTYRLGGERATGNLIAISKGVRLENRSVFPVSEILDPVTGAYDPKVSLISTDGTTNGTWVLRSDLEPSGSAHSTAGMIAWNGQAYLTSPAPGVGRLLVTNGKRGDLRELARVPVVPPLGKPPAPSMPHTQFAPAGSRLVFTGYSGPGRLQLWSTDGTPGGTKPLNVSGPDGIPPYLLAAGPVAVIGVASADRLDQYWISDGTPQGTRKVADGVFPIAVLHGKVFLGNAKGEVSVAPLQ